MKSLPLTLLALALAISSPAQKRSEKRGLGWDESQTAISTKAAQLLSPGVSWIYNWGQAPKSEPSLMASGDLVFLPMAWNGNFNEQAIRNYLAQHPTTKRILGFNEPNFSSQSNMSPTAAATAWKKLEAIAADYDVELVAPALNFTGERVAGRTWSPFEWYDAFFEAYPDAKADYLAFHCYMNWAANIDWIADRYFYTEGSKDEQNLFYADNQERYPHFVAWMTRYKDLHGHYPRLFLTEFCSWESNVYPYAAGLTVDFQIDQLTQKVQYLERSSNVAGYAWFMGNASGGYTSFPYMSVMQQNSAASELSELGKVYVHMSAFDADKYYAPGDTILAKDYIDATLDNRAVHVRSNTDAASTSPLQVELPSSGSVSYQLSIPSAAGEESSATYTLRLRHASTAAIPLLLYVDGKRQSSATLPATAGQWATASVQLTLSEGQHTLLLFNFADDPLLLSELLLQAPETGIEATTEGHAANALPAYYHLDGTRASAQSKGLVIKVARGSKAMKVIQ